MGVGGLESVLHKYLHTSLRGMVEFGLVAAVFIFAVPTPRSLVYGALVSAVGLLLRLWSSGYGRKGGALDGPFRWLRHPHLLGSLLLFLGLCLAGRSAPVMAAALVALSLMHAQAFSRADTALAANLGPGFAVYRAEVPALLPRLWPHAAAAPGMRAVFTWRQALLKGRHRELDAAVALGIAWGLLYLLAKLPQEPRTHLIVATIVLVSIVLRFVYYAVSRRRRR